MVAELGNVTKAAERLGLTQSAASAAIAAIENTYQGATSSLHSETNSLATSKTLSSAELTTQMKKFVENGPANNSNEAKKAFKEKIQIFEQAITNKKTDEANSKTGIWT